MHISIIGFDKLLAIRPHKRRVKIPVKHYTETYEFKKDFLRSLSMGEIISEEMSRDNQPDPLEYKPHSNTRPF